MRALSEADVLVLYPLICLRYFIFLKGNIQSYHSLQIRLCMTIVMGTASFKVIPLIVPIASVTSFFSGTQKTSTLSYLSARQSTPSHTSPPCPLDFLTTSFLKQWVNLFFLSHISKTVSFSFQSALAGRPSLARRSLLCCTPTSDHLSAHLS